MFRVNRLGRPCMMHGRRKPRADFLPLSGPSNRRPEHAGIRLQAPSAPKTAARSLRSPTQYAWATPVLQPLQNVNRPGRPCMMHGRRKPRADFLPLSGPSNRRPEHAVKRLQAPSAPKTAARSLRSPTQYAWATPVLQPLQNVNRPGRPCMMHGRRKPRADFLPLSGSSNRRPEHAGIRLQAPSAPKTAARSLRSPTQYAWATPGSGHFGFRAGSGDSGFRAGSGDSILNYLRFRYILTISAMIMIEAGF